MTDSEIVAKIFKILRRNILLLPYGSCGQIAPRKGTTRQECYNALYEIQELVGARSFFCNPPINTAVGYVPPLKKTNADRIRSMTDEELAEFFVAIQNDVADYYDGGHAFEPDFPTHKDAWLGWLKAEDGCE